MLLNGGIMNETLVYKQRVQAVDNKPYVTLDSTSNSTNITTMGSIYSAYSDISTIKLMIFHDILSVSLTDIENLPSMIDFINTVPAFDIFQVNYTLTHYYSDLSGSTQPIDNSKTYKVVLYVKDSIGSEVSLEI